jgi:hypothetical protein
VDASALSSPLFLESWVEFNRRRWNVRAERVVLGEPGGTPRLEALLYRGRSGRLVRPARTFYVPVAFETAPGTGRHRAYSQWDDLSNELAAHMAAAGVAQAQVLPPEVADVRAWQWNGFVVGVRYTYYQDLPYDLGQASQSVRAHVKKARAAGYNCRRSDSVADVASCQVEMEQRAGYDHEYTAAHLDAAQRFVGPDHFRCYTAYAPSGEPAASNVVLHNPGGRALGWLMATRTAHLPSGVNQLLQWHLLQDLADAGAAGLDMVGASLESIAAAKASWRPRLLPHYTVEERSPRLVASFAYRGLQDVYRRYRRVRTRT